MSMNEEVALEPEPFLSALRTAMRPEVLLQAGDDLAALVAAVKDVGKKGRLTLTVDLVPDKKDPEVVFVTVDTEAKPPRPTPNARLLWPMANGRLSTRDPRQLEMTGLSAVEGGREDHDNTEENAG